MMDRALLYLSDVAHGVVRFVPMFAGAWIAYVIASTLWTWLP